MIDFFIFSHAKYIPLKFSQSHQRFVLSCEQNKCALDAMDSYFGGTCAFSNVECMKNKKKVVWFFTIFFFK